MKNKSYYLAYSVTDSCCDVRARHIVVEAPSAPYAVEKLRGYLSCMYRNFRIARVVLEVESLREEEV